MTKPDYHALCAELIDALENARRIIDGADGTLHINTAEFVLRRARALLVQPEPEGPTLQWGQNMPASESCRYDHCIAETPFGRFLITWKSWKQYASPTVDETPWGDWYAAFNSVDKAKAACQQEFNQRLARCALSPTPQPPADREVAELVDKCITTYAEDLAIISSGRHMLIDDGEARDALRARLADLLQRQHPQTGLSYTCDPAGDIGPHCLGS